MRHRHLVWVWLAGFGAVCSAAQPRITWMNADDASFQSGGEKPLTGEQFVGTWTGTWDGAGASGGFELTLEKDKDGAVTGRVSVTGEPTYKAPFKTLAFDGNKMTAKYDFPADDRAEVALAATFDGNKATGTWSLREKGNDNEVASGGWTVTKK